MVVSGHIALAGPLLSREMPGDCHWFGESSWNRSFRAVAYLTDARLEQVLRLEARSSTVSSLRLYGRLCGRTCDSRHCTTRALTGQIHSGSKRCTLQTR